MLSIAKKVHNDFIKILADKRSKVDDLVAHPTSQDRSSEIIRFVGFALSKVLRKYRKTEKNTAKGFDPDDIADAVEFLEDIRSTI